MSEFSDRPFVAGSLVGLRAFDVDSLGRLVGPSYKTVFKPGVNEAECRGFAAATRGIPRDAELVQAWGTARAGLSGFSYSDPRWTLRLSDGNAKGYQTLEELTADYPPPPDATHTVGAADCSCGYYAYFDGGNDYETDGRVTVIVEGTGVCTVGGRGFRASRGRLLAFVNTEPSAAPVADVTPDESDNDPHPRWDRWSDWCYRSSANIPLTVLGLIVGVTAFVAAFPMFAEVSWMLGSLLLLVALGSVSAAVVSDRGWDHGLTRNFSFNHSDLKCKSTPLVPERFVAAIAPPASSVRWDLVRRNYPDVPVYPTVAEALAEFPLTAPPPPSPKDEDFWTRPVA